MQKHVTTIRVHEDLWNFVSSQRVLGESYEDTLNRLLGRKESK